MALPSTGGGYQIGDGNTNEIDFDDLNLPVQTATSTATLTTDQTLNRMLVGNPSTTAATYTLPTAASVEAVMTNMRVGKYFDFCVVNIGTSTGVITMAVGTGWTITGLATLPTAAAGSSAQFRCVKTAAGAWTAYRIA